MKRWLNDTRVHAFDGRIGTVVGEPGLYAFPEVRWDNGTVSEIDGDLLEQALGDL